MRIQGITLPDNKRIVIALTEVYGVGLARSKTILGDLGIDENVSVPELSEADEKKLREAVEKFLIEGDLKREVSGNIQRLKDIKSYRGRRHATNNPVRGQRTKTNKRTAMGNKRNTMGSGRTKVEKK